MQDYDFQDLQNRINTLEEKMDYVYKHLQLTFIPKPDVDDPRIVELIQKGKMIQAIQLYCELHPNTYLADAKRDVEEIKLRHGL